MAKINEIKSVLTGMTPKPPVTVADTGKEIVIKSPIKKEATKVRDELGNFLATLKEGKDFGYLPNIPKPVLFKSGALRILQFLKCSYEITLVDKTIIPAEKLISYTVSVTILTADGKQVGQALGSTNSLEAKFARSGFSADNMLVSMATKRALISAVKAIIATYRRNVIATN